MCLHLPPPGSLRVLGAPEGPGVDSTVITLPESSVVVVEEYWEKDKV